MRKILERFSHDGVLDQRAAHIVAEFCRCADWIKAALKHSGGTHEPIDVLEGILTRDYQLWPAVQSFVVTEINVYPRKKILNIFLAGGDYDELKNMLPDIETFAELEGCQAVMLVGRKGWLRSFLPGMGYEAASQVMTKELSHG